MCPPDDRVDASALLPKSKAQVSSGDDAFRRLGQALMRGRGAEKDKTWGKAVVLVGAGCSVSAGIPTGRDIVLDCAKELAALYGQTGLPQRNADEKIDAFSSRVLDWLVATKILPSDTTWHNAYGRMFEHHYPNANEQRSVIEHAIEKGENKINWTHLCLGELVRQRFVHTVLTTNFDTLALEGCIRANIIPVVADGLDALQRISSTPKHPQLVHLHGSRHAYKLLNETEDVQDTKNSIAAQGVLFTLLKDANVFIVVGYAGGEEGVMHLLIDAAAKLPGILIYWVAYNPDPGALSARARDLMGHKGHGEIIAGQNSDEFFRRLMEETKLGVPSWMNDPMEVLVADAKRIAKTGNDLECAEKLLAKSRSKQR